MTDDSESAGERSADAADPSAADAADHSAADAADHSAADATGPSDASSDAGGPADAADRSPTEGEEDGRAQPAGPAATDAPVPGDDDAGLDPTEIDPAELTVPERSLNPRIRIVWVVRAILTALVAGVVAGAADFYVFEVGLVLPVGVAALFLVLGVPHALLRYRVWRYEVREDALYLERGVLTRVRTVVPFVRIQHVDTSRGPIERGIGLATSVVYTAGSRGADVTIPGLEADRAEDLQRRLKRLAIASEGDTAV